VQFSTLVLLLSILALLVKKIPEWAKIERESRAAGARMVAAAVPGRAGDAAASEGGADLETSEGASGVVDGVEE
jgi:hypothetical protein